VLQQKGTERSEKWNHFRDKGARISLFSFCATKIKSCDLRDNSFAVRNKTKYFYILFG
jgi:hypothetical protein